MQGAEGKLIYYYKDPYRKVPIFISGNAPRCLLWIGGQAESFFTISYFEDLAKSLNEEWSFVQMELPSSHIGYGAPNHYADSDDVDEVLELLTTKHDMKEIVLFATSTGVQIALQLLDTGRNVNTVTRVILHGVVSPPDNQFFSEKATAARSDRVTELLKTGRNEDSEGMVGFYDIPVTPARLSQGGFLTLQEALWMPALQDDSDTVTKAFNKISVPTLIMIANDAQYKPTKEDVDKVIQTARKSLGCPEDDSIIELFDDTCDELRRLLKADIPHHVKSITSFLKNADEKRAKSNACEEERRAEEERQKRIALSKLLCQ